MVSLLLPVGSGLVAGGVTNIVPSNRSDEKLKEGRRLYAEEKFSCAHDLYLQGIELDPYDGCAHQNIGLVYEMIPVNQATQNLCKDYFKAVAHYLLAIGNGYLKADQDVSRVLSRDDLLPDTINKIGIIYHGKSLKDFPLHVGKGVKFEFTKAQEMYLLAAQKGSVVALRNMGLLQEEGKNYIEAAKYYQKAIDAGYISAKEDLNRLLNNSVLVGETLVNIALLYHHGNEVKLDAAESIKLMKMAMEKGCSWAFLNYGVYLVIGFGLPIDYCEAAMYYRQAEAIGCPRAIEYLTNLQVKADEGTKAYVQHPEDMEALRLNSHLSRKNFKKIFRVVIHNNFLRNRSQHIDVNKTDQRNWTWLHHASMYRPNQPLFKLCARLRCLNADTDRVTAEGKQPFTDLDDKQFGKVQNLQAGLNRIINQFEMSPPDVILGSCIDNAESFDRAKISITLKELYQCEPLKPLLDLVKLACLGVHDLSHNQRDRYKNNDYDSDNDDLPEKINENNSKFNIVLDAGSETVEGICYFGSNGRGGTKAFGAYQHSSTVYVGAKADSDKRKMELIGIILHEITHFVANEVYQNGCNPYAQTDLSNLNLFKIISDELDQQRDNLPPILNQAFTLYEPSSYHIELIARVSQMFAEDPNGARAILQRDAPRLLNYYEHAFLPAVRAHCRKIEERALAGWSKEMFLASRKGTISFQQV